MKYLHACVYFYIHYKYAQHTYIYTYIQTKTYQHFFCQ